MAIVLFAALCIYLLRLPHPDVAWYLVATDKFLRGGHLYLDIVEVNPPLAFYLHALPVAVAIQTGWDPVACFVVYMFALIVVALFLARHVHHRTPHWDSITCNVTLWGCFAALVILPFQLFGEREHFLLVFTLPYFFLVYLRRIGGPYRLAPALTIGALASLGICLKPHFLIAFVFAESYLMFHRPSIRTLNRPEVWAIVVFFLVYLIFLFRVHPEYIADILPMAILTYTGYGRSPALILLNPANLWIIMPLAVAISGRLFKFQDDFADFMTLVAVAFLATYLLQAKGWEYQLLPAVTFAFIGQTGFALALLKNRSSNRPSQKMFFAASIATIVMLLFAPLDNNRQTPKFVELLLPVVENHPSDRTIYVFSAELAVGFPLTNAAHLNWSSRFPSLWPLAGAVRLYQDTPSAERLATLTATLKYVTNSVVEDFQRLPPDLVVVDRASPILSHYGPRSMDFLRLLLRDSKFADTWWAFERVDVVPYEQFGRRRELEIWTRRTDAAS